MAEHKERLDILLVDHGLADDVITARALIGGGKVLVNGQLADKAGSLQPKTCTLSIKEGKRFVSRAGEKLAAALTGFAIDPAGLICADIGASTGGFTDCLLQAGASLVFSVDVGYGLLDWRLRQDSRVVVLERINGRNLSRDLITRPLDLAVIDASFISLELLLPPLLPLFRCQACILALIKPQFELERSKVGKGGIVRESRYQQEAVELVRGFGRQHNLRDCGVIASPVKGTKGNQEYVILLRDDLSSPVNGTP